MQKQSRLWRRRRRLEFRLSIVLQAQINRRHRRLEALKWSSRSTRVHVTDDKPPIITQRSALVYFPGWGIKQTNKQTNVVGCYGTSVSNHAKLQPATLLILNALSPTLIPPAYSSCIGFISNIK